MCECLKRRPETKSWEFGSRFATDFESLGGLPLEWLAKDLYGCICLYHRLWLGEKSPPARVLVLSVVGERSQRVKTEPDVRRRMSLIFQEVDAWESCFVSAEPGAHHNAEAYFPTAIGPAMTSLLARWCLPEAGLRQLCNRI